MSSIDPEQVRKLQQRSAELRTLEREERERKAKLERAAIQKRNKELRERTDRLKAIKGNRQGFTFAKENLISTVHWLETHSATRYRPEIYLLDQGRTNKFRREFPLTPELNLSSLPSEEGVIFLSESFISGHETQFESRIVPSEKDNVKKLGESIETVTALLWAHRLQSTLLNLVTFRVDVSPSKDTILPETIQTRISFEVPNKKNIINLSSSDITLIEQKIYQMFGYILQRLDIPLMESQSTQKIKKIHLTNDSPPDIQTVTISNYKSRSTNLHPEEHLTKKYRDYSHRFDVRGHYRNIRVNRDSEETKKVWIDGYVKGSTEKPYVKKKRIWKI